jgi:DNA-binding MarR family transcriptional regulator
VTGVDGSGEGAGSAGVGAELGGRGLVDAVLAASQMMVAVAARSLDAAASEVTLPQFRVLVMLSLRGAQRPGDIAADLAVEPSTATRMCDRLVRKELVTRAHATEDRRTVVVELTTAGQELVGTVMHRRRLEFERLATAVPSEQHEAVISALRVLIDASGARPDRDWALWA